MSIPEWLSQFKPADVIAMVAIVVSAAFSVVVLRMQVHAGRRDALLQTQRAAHLRFWSAANSWLLHLQRARDGEDVRSNEGDLPDNQRATYEAFREIEIVAPTVVETCRAVLVDLVLAQSDLRQADDAGVVKPGHVDTNARETIAFDDDVNAARLRLNELVEEMRAFNAGIPSRRQPRRR